MASVKEVHFFDDESVDWSNPDYGRLLNFFTRTSNDTLVRGEATPIYTYWPKSLERLSRYNPSAKLIVILRHPSFRAFSHWRMETTRKWETLSFAEAIGEGAHRVRDAPDGIHRVFSYVERGNYASQVQRLLDLFPRNQLLFLRTDQLWMAPQDVLDQVQEFLGISRRLRAERRYFSPLDTSNLGEIPARERGQLDRHYSVDIRRTAELTGLELSDWLDPSYREPMTMS